MVNRDELEKIMEALGVVIEEEKVADAAARIHVNGVELEGELQDELNKYNVSTELVPGSTVVESTTEMNAIHRAEENTREWRDRVVDALKEAGRHELASDVASWRVNAEVIE